MNPSLKAVYSDAPKLRLLVEQQQQDLSESKARLAELEKNCSHSWGQSIAAHIYHEAYAAPGDVPGTMGVDYRGPVHVPSRTENRWKRVCSRCGKVEYTSQTQDVVIEKRPVFR